MSLSPMTRRALNTSGWQAGAASEIINILTSVLSPGNKWYVSSVIGSAGNSGNNEQEPVATIAQAQAKATANNNDIIILLPGHAETISAAGGITLSKAGITIVGIGNKNNRPTLTWSATASTLAISAANVTIRNIRTKVSIDSVVKMFDITGAGCTLDAVDFVETASVQALNFLTTTAAADSLTIQNCNHVQVAAGAAKWIDLVGSDNSIVRDSQFFVSASTHILGGTTTESLNLLVENNRFVNPADAAGVVLLASTTGFVHNNYGGGAKSAQAGFFALASAYGGYNAVTNAANKNGTIDPAADT